MSRAACDNALLAACDDLHGQFLKVLAMAFLTFIGIGCVWFLCLAVPAGALWK
ncbi:hypothetical protein [Paraburkholderia xenovorans]|uniref:hypothetical protein n=1 Tax=Paraburkholderia xenovorans TaxID=36873 RepID=UPI0015C54857|nr:hypothetical protein [Paraburkholderia xenovorans]